MKTKYKLFRKNKLFWQIFPPPEAEKSFELFWEIDTKTAYIKFNRKEVMEQISKKEYKRLGKDEFFYVPPSNMIQMIYKVKPPKKVSISSLKHKAWNLFSTYIRLRDCLQTTGSSEYGKCITCGKIYSFEQLQASHFIAGRSNAVLFDEEMVHAACYQCNVGLHGNILEYRRKIIEMYGEDYDLVLETRSKQLKKFTIEYLQILITSFKQKILELGGVE